MRRFLITLIAALISLSFFMQIEMMNKAESEHFQIQEEKENPITLSHLVDVALQPVGQTMYVWGGGWNEEDTGSGIEARTLGISPRWKEFYEQQNSGYDFQTTQYQIHDGLDCSGYIGWILYNVFETENEQPGYVTHAGKMIDDFVNRGWGTKIERNHIESYQCGDILANEGHIYLVIASCPDGSVLFTHASPPGVRICGTPAKDGTTNSQAVNLAEQIMSEHFPEWYAKFPKCSVEYAYLTDYDQFRWNDTLQDPQKLSSKSAEEIVEQLF